MRKKRTVVMIDMLESGQNSTQISLSKMTHHKVLVLLKGSIIRGERGIYDKGKWTFVKVKYLQ